MTRSTNIGLPRSYRSITPHAARVSLCLAAVLLSFALHTGPGCQTPKPPGALETCDDIYEQRAALGDSVITLTGRFMGWNGTDCVFPSYAAPQEMRSDWVFMIGTTCLYVTGGAPPGLSGMDDTSMEKQITLYARVHVTRDGRLLLKYVDSAPKSQ